MPGIVGFTDIKNKLSIRMLENMRNLLKHENDYIDSKLCNFNFFYCTNTQLPYFKNQSIMNNNICLFFDGEFYNRSELKKKFNVTSKTDIELFYDIYTKQNSFDFLIDLDGSFTSVLFNKKKNEINLISDRFGFKPLYWSILNNNLVWSSELKGFLLHDDFKININKTAVNDFFKHGYLLNNDTWFSNVNLIPPASILTFDIKSLNINIKKYWDWNNIQSQTNKIDQRELAIEFKELFINSINKRINKNDRIGISLSGGLDSRLILAATDNTKTEINTFTFGKKESYDLHIAKIVSKIKGVPNHSLELNEKNWLYPRINKIWHSDGLFNIMHMHGMEFNNLYKKYMDINLNGFCGDAILGGSYIKKRQSVESLFNNRGRRFINQALIASESQIIQRRPFFDNDLMDFILKIPKRYRKKSAIYNEMLLQIYPNYFKNVPCTNRKGYPLNYSKLKVKLINTKNKILNKKQSFQKNYTNYPNWIRNNSNKSFFNKIILNKDAIFPNYINFKKAKYYLNQHMNNKMNFHEELCLIITFEIWLKQIYENKYRINSEI